jgi:hypothetical protein
MKMKMSSGGNGLMIKQKNMDHTGPSLKPSRTQQSIASMEERHEAQKNLPHVGECVKTALEKSGYGTEGILTAKFQGWNHTNDEIHSTTFINDDIEGGTDHGAVCIDKDGKGEF